MILLKICLLIVIAEINIFVVFSFLHVLAIELVTALTFESLLKLLLTFYLYPLIRLAARAL